MISLELVAYNAKSSSKSIESNPFIPTNQLFSYVSSSDSNNFVLEFTETTNVMKIEPWYKIHKKFNERNMIDFYNVQDIILGKAGASKSINVDAG